MAPTAGDLAGVDRDARRAEMRRRSEQPGRITKDYCDRVRQQIQERRDAARAEQANCREPFGRIRPEV